MAQLVVFLNELSVASLVLPLAEAQNLVRELIDTLRAIRAHESSVSLNAVIRLPDHLVDTQKTIQQTLRGDAFREEWQFIRRLVDRSPFSYDLPNPDAMADVDYLFEGRQAKALGWAHLQDTAGVSFASGAVWNEPNIHIVRYELDGSGEIIESGALVRHFSSRTHADHWREWLVAYGADDIPTASELWETRGERFRHLRFLDRVEGDLRHLANSGAAYQRCLAALHVLDRDLMKWNGAGHPAFSTKVTPESEQRKELCRVADIDGNKYYFDLHARFTGAFPGRIHFLVSSVERKAIVAYVGRKLEAPIVGD